MVLVKQTFIVLYCFVFIIVLGWANLIKAAENKNDILMGNYLRSEQLYIADISESKNVKQSKYNITKGLYTNRQLVEKSNLKSINLLSNKSNEKSSVSENIDKNKKQNHFLINQPAKKLNTMFSFKVSNNDVQYEYLNPLIVTATKIPSQLKQISDIKRVITAKELQTLGVTTVEDALKIVSNISITNTSGTKSLFMRGQHSGATKVLYNGIDLRDIASINGASLFKLIPIEDVKQIEIISGSKSTLYGSGALAGVINVVTDTTNPIGYVKSKISYNQQYTTLKATTTFPKTNLYVIANQQNNNTLSAQTTDTEIDGLNQQSLTVGFDHKPIIPGNIDGLISFVNQQQDLDGGSYEAVEFNSNMLKINYTYNPIANLTTMATWSNTYANRDYMGTTKTIIDYYLSNYNKVELNNSYIINDNQSLLVGADLAMEDMSSSEFDSNKTQDSAGIYAQYRWLNPTFSMQIEVRSDQYTSDSENTLQTYNLSFFRYIPELDLRVNFALKTGFRIPTLYENNYNGSSLVAENTKTREMSFQKVINNILFKMTYFNTHIANKISYDLTSDQYTNTTRSTQQGFEYLAKFEPIGVLDFLTIAYSDIHAFDNQVPAIGVPDYKATITAGINQGNLVYGACLIHEGDKPESSTITLSSYTYIDLNIQYRYNNQTTLIAKLHNIFNEQYQTASGYNQPNRTMYIGVNRQFK